MFLPFCSVFTSEHSTEAGQGHLFHLRTSFPSVLFRFHPFVSSPARFSPILPPFIPLQKKTLLANGINGKRCNTIQQSRTQRYSGSLPDGEASCRLFPQAISLFPSNPLVRNSSLRLPNCSLYMRSEHATVPWNHRFRDPSGPLHGLAPSNFAFSDPSCSYYSLSLLMPIANRVKKWNAPALCLSIAIYC